MDSRIYGTGSYPERTGKMSAYCTWFFPCITAGYHCCKYLFCCLRVRKGILDTLITVRLRDSGNKFIKRLL